ncbi:hypothetical protein ACWDRR_43035 [Kitasatospora sp. NPDC003701]
MTHSPAIPLPVSEAGAVSGPDLAPVPRRVAPPPPVPLGGDLAAAMMSAAASRPVEEVADLLCHLNPAHTPTLAPVLHQAVASRPVEDLVRLLVLLRPRDRAGADRILRAAVLTRPTGDVAHLTALLAIEADSGIHAALHTAASLRPVADVAHLAQLLRPAPAADRPTGSPARSDDTEPSPDSAPCPPTRVLSRARPREQRPPLRWPAAAALLATGALHLPLVVAHWGQSPAVSVVTALAALCLFLGAALALRGAPWAWIAGAATAATALTGDLLSGSLAPVQLVSEVAQWHSRFGPAALACEVAVLALTAAHAATRLRRRTGVRAGRAAVRT